MAAHEAVAQADSVSGSVQRVNARLDSLERVALANRSFEQRLSATVGIASPGGLWFVAHPGSETPPPEIRYSGIVERLVRIYRRSEYSVRNAIISLMIHQAERAKAVAFLAEVAQEPAPPPVAGVAIVDDTWPLPYNAIMRLTHMGPEGRATLQRLQAQGTVREPMARAELEELARRGFRKAGGS